MTAKRTRNDISTYRVRRIEGTQKAFELRKAGASLRQIAAALGEPQRLIQKWLVDEMNLMCDKMADSVEHARRLEVERLDQLVMSYWQKANSGNTAAANVVLKVMERRSSLLGLDAPKKIAPTDPTGEFPYRGATDDELRAMAGMIIDVNPSPDLPALPDNGCSGTLVQPTIEDLDDGHCDAEDRPGDNGAQGGIAVPLDAACAASPA